jgi:hypothetical protein
VIATLRESESLVSYEALEGRDRELVQIVDAAYQRAEPEHKTFRGKAEEFYRLYRGFTDFRTQHRDARDRDAVTSAAQAEWGAELFIPFATRRSRRSSRGWWPRGRG